MELSVLKCLKRITFDSVLINATPMKQTLLFTTLLLGFGLLAPATCSKSKTNKEEAQKEDRNTTKPAPKQLALYGPTIKVVAPGKA
jgi:di/tricarboxylate transporter